MQLVCIHCRFFTGHLYKNQILLCIGRKQNAFYCRRPINNHRKKMGHKNARRGHCECAFYGRRKNFATQRLIFEFENAQLHTNTRHFRRTLFIFTSARREIRRPFSHVRIFSVAIPTRSFLNEWLIKKLRDRIRATAPSHVRSLRHFLW